MAASVLDDRYVPADAPVDADLPVTAAAAPGGGAIVPVSGVSWVPYAADRPYHGQVMQMDASPVPLDPGITVRPGQVVGLGWFCKKELHPDNRVWFDDDDTDDARHARDPHRLLPDRPGPPAIAGAIDEIRSRPSLGPTPRRRVRDAARELAALSRAPPAWAARMTARPSATPTGRVWGTTNVYVGGNNVVPTATACNPTLTAVALGVLTARSLVDSLAATSRLKEPTHESTVIIIGSGPTGATYARLLLEQAPTSSV